MENLKIVFMGTPEFACSILQALIDEKYNVVGVISQPDKKIGRKQEMKYTPVKELALKNNIKVIQPIKIKNEYDEILQLNPDMIVTCAYGQMVPEVILNAPKYVCVNVHASLLPKYRGGAPIHKAIICGEKESGITIMKMVKQMDAGEMYLKRKVVIEDDDTTEILHDKLMDCGSKLIKEFIPKFINGEIVGEVQKEEEATFAYNISSEEEFVSFKNRNIDEIYNQIRGLISWPVGYGIIENKRIKFHKALKICKNHSYEAGQIIGFENGMQIACNGGFINILTLQLEGKSKVNYRDFANGSGKNFINKCFE